MQNLPISRDEAEFLDDLLLSHVKSTNELSIVAGNIAAQLCETWGMSYWHHRKDSGITTYQWAELVKFSEAGHREKSVIR